MQFFGRGDLNFPQKKADESKYPAGGYLLRLFDHARAASLHQYHNHTFDCANGTYHRIISTAKPQIPKIQKGREDMDEGVFQKIFHHFIKVLIQGAPQVCCMLLK